MDPAMLLRVGGSYPTCDKSFMLSEEEEEEQLAVKISVFCFMHVDSGY